MDSINIAIGASDHASKILDEVQGKVHSFSKNVTSATNSAAQSNKGFDVSFLGLGKAMGVVGVGIAAVKGLMTAVSSVNSFLSESVSGLDAADEAVRRLSLAIELNGEDASASIESHKELAEALERELNIDADVATGLMAQAAAMGVADDQLDSMTKSAVGLSETMGIGLQESLNLVRKATEGSFKAFEKAIPSIKNLTSDSAKLSAVIALSEKGLLQRADAANTAGQADERAGFATGKLQDSIGAMLSPLREFAFDGIGYIATSINNTFGPALEAAGVWLDDFKNTVFASFTRIVDILTKTTAIYFEYIGNIWGAIFGEASFTFDDFANAIGDGLQWLSDKFITFITFCETVFLNLGKVFEIARDSTLLTLETLRADLEQLFLETIPKYTIWFAENFTRIISDMASNTLTIFENLASAIQESVSLIWQFITGGISFGDLMSGLGEQAGRDFTEGFVSTTDPLPKIAERALTDTEKALQLSLSTNTASLVEEFQTKVTERIGRVQKDLKAKPLMPDINLDLTKTAGKLEELKATESRLLTRGDGSSDPNIQIAENTKRTAESQKRQADEQARTNELLTQIAGKPSIEYEAVA